MLIVVIDKVLAQLPEAVIKTLLAVVKNCSDTNQNVKICEIDNLHVPATS